MIEYLLYNSIECSLAEALMKRLKKNYRLVKDYGLVENYELIKNIGW